MRIPGYLDKTGRVLLPSAPRVWMDRVAVWVEIPEAALNTSTKTKSDTSGKVAPPLTLAKRTKEMLAELDAIRAQPVEEDELLEWSEDFQARWETFELRDALRNAQGGLQ